MECAPDCELITDHHPLIHLQTQPNLSRRQTRWMEFLSRFPFVIKYAKGMTNVAEKNKKNRATVLVAVALSIFVGSGDLCWLCMVIRGPASPSPLHVALARGVCASGLCGSRTGPRGPPSPAAAERWFQLSGVRPRVPLLPPFLPSLLLATWGFSSCCSMAVSSGAAAAGPGQDPISAHAAHLNLPPSASPP